MTPQEKAAEIVSAFATFSFNLGAKVLYAQPADELRAAIAKAIMDERERLIDVVQDHACKDVCACKSEILREINESI